MADRDAFVQHYCGAQLPDDAWWWATYPGTPAPTGNPDPELAVRALRDRLFAPDSSETDRVAYAAAHADLLTERAEVERALAAVEADNDRVAAAALNATPVDSATDDAAPPPVRRARGLIVLALAAVTIVTVIGVVTAMGIGGTATVGQASHPPAHAVSPNASASVVSQGLVKLVSIPAKLDGEITRSTIHNGLVHSNVVTMPTLENGILVHLACSGPTHSTMDWSLIDESGSAFGVSGTIKCDAQITTEGDALVNATATSVEVQIEPSQGVIAGYAILTRN